MLNYSELGRNFCLSDQTCRKCIDILAGTFMIEVIPPWIANLSKRQVKSPKLRFRDTGLFHSLLQISDRKNLLSHPRLGNSWESLVFNTLRAWHSGEIYFWSTQSKAEIDFVIPTKKGLIGVEAKFSDAPKLTPSMRLARQDLGLRRIDAVYPGSKSYPLSESVQVITLEELIAKKDWV